MALLYKTNGEVKTIKPKNKKHFTGHELHELVGGYIETVYLPSGEILVCNEEGKLLGLPYNKMASENIWFKYFGFTDVLCGDVVVCKIDEID